jgi:cytochrome c oxidase subunit 3
VNTGAECPACGGTEQTVENLAREVEKRREAEQRLDSARFGMWLFLVAEVMFFAGFLGAVIVSRSNQPVWPPEGMQPIPVGLPAVNLAVLVASAFGLEAAAHALKHGERRKLSLRLLLTLLLGVAFLAVQIVEYVRNWAAGFTLLSNPAGNYFYVLAWVHGVHVAGGIVFLTWVTLLARRNALHLGRRVPLDLSRMYWHFVVLVWFVLFVLLYLS